MRKSRQGAVVCAIVLAAATAGGVALAESDSTPSRDGLAATPTAPSAQEARARAETLAQEAEKLSGQPAEDSAVPAPQPSDPARAEARIKAAVSNAATVARTYGVSAESASAGQPAQVVTGVAKPLVEAALSTGDSNKSSYSTSDTLSVVQVSGEFSPPAPPPSPDRPIAAAPKYQHLIVVTDDRTTEIREIAMDDGPLDLARLSTDVEWATVPR